MRPSVLDIIQDFRRHGYSVDFTLDDSCRGKFVVDGLYRVDEMSDPDEQAVVYALSSVDEPVLRGIVVTGYGATGNSRLDEILETFSMGTGLQVRGVAPDQAAPVKKVA